MNNKDTVEAPERFWISPEDVGNATDSVPIPLFPDSLGGRGIEYQRVDPPAALTGKWDKAGLKEACQRALKLGRTHQEMDIQLVLDMLLEIERLEASTSNG